MDVETGTWAALVEAERGKVASLPQREHTYILPFMFAYKFDSCVNTVAGQPVLVTHCGHGRTVVIENISMNIYTQKNRIGNAFK